MKELSFLFVSHRQVTAPTHDQTAQAQQREGRGGGFGDRNGLELGSDDVD